METEDIITVKLYVSPIGPLLLGSIDERLCLCDWRTTAHRQQIDERLQARLSASFREGTSDVIELAQTQLEDYFSRRRNSFNVPLLFSGTDFQQAVWQELLHIPYGMTISYAELACRIGKPTAVRAVANANNANPISIFVPCHRVIGSNRKLIGYGGGVAIKQELLSLESGMNYLWKDSGIPF